MCGGNIDRDAIAVSAPTVRSHDRTAIVGPLARPQIHEEAIRQFVEFIGYFLQRFRRAVDLGEFDLSTVLARKPYDVDRVCHKSFCAAVTVHFLEKWLIPHTSWIEIKFWCKALLAGRIFCDEHIFDVRIIEHRVESLRALAVVDMHARAILPNKIV